MALPSQQSRAGNWRTSSSGGGGGTSVVHSAVTFVRQNTPLVVGVLVAGTALGGWLWYRSAYPATVRAGDAAPGDTFLPKGSTGAGSVAAGASAAVEPSKPSPAVISMGMLNDGVGKVPGAGNAGTVDDLVAQAGSQGSRQAPPPGRVEPVTPVATPTLPPPVVIDPATPAPTPGVPGGGVSAGGVGGDAGAMALEQGQRLVQQNKLVEARSVLNTALLNGAVSSSSRGAIRAQMATINATLFFSPTVVKGDPLTDEHVVASGETLGRIVRRQGLPIDWRFLVRINRMPSENALKVGQRIKVIRQPVHAVVSKGSYRMDLYAGAPGAGGATGPDGQDAGWVYLRSLPVGLGESNGTPEGLFVVRPSSKLINPKWVNPRTGEVFMPDDPKNPIGEHWIGLDGADATTKSFAGYGIHGTIDPESIGQQKSMGCVRLAADDVALVYELLIERLSTVRIVP